MMIQEPASYSPLQPYNNSIFDIIQVEILFANNNYGCTSIITITSNINIKYSCIRFRDLNSNLRQNVLQCRVNNRTIGAMESDSGKKIFVLYPDEKLRNTFYGNLRNVFELYYIYDYEKVQPLASYYPQSIVVLNMINNDLDWLPEEIHNETGCFDEDDGPVIIGLTDADKPDREYCTRIILYDGDDEKLKEDLFLVFSDLGGKGRRNFVRYGGREEKIAAISLKINSVEHCGAVHDISASGLSCSFPVSAEIPVGTNADISLELDGEELAMAASKILERNIGGKIVHIFKFNLPMSPEANSGLLGFMYKSLDAEMNEFIKNLSN